MADEYNLICVQNELENVNINVSEDLDSSGQSSCFSDDDYQYIRNKYQIYNKDVSQLDAKLKKCLNKINIDPYECHIPKGVVQNQVLEINKRIENSRLRIKDKKDRATVEQVLDPRTRMILFKLLNQRLLEEIDGCISTGKEANVYHALSFDGRHYALKIYKTSILTFRDRDRYVTGEFRFRRGYCRHNPRKMVRLWAEKEMRNLCRIHAASIPCPQPVLLKGNVLVMEFLGSNGWPFPKLKDVSLNFNLSSHLYYQCITIMRQLFCSSHLVHADLSEFNILCNDEQLFIIDVGQAVEADHPRALDFLRVDCYNITEFFCKLGIETMSVRQLFEFVTDTSLLNSNIDVYYLENLQNLHNNIEEKQKDKIFMETFIPQRLDQISDLALTENTSSDLLYKTIGLISDKSNRQQYEEDNDTEVSDSSDDEKSQKISNARPRNESPNSKKERKKAVREKKKEKRKIKIKKYVKKRQEKLKKSHLRR